MERRSITQELLGHSDPSTTAGYCAYSHVDAAAAVASLSFRATAIERGETERVLKEARRDDEIMARNGASFP